MKAPGAPIGRETRVPFRPIDDHSNDVLNPKKYDRKLAIEQSIKIFGPFRKTPRDKKYAYVERRGEAYTASSQDEKKKIKN